MTLSILVDIPPLKVHTEFMCKQTEVLFIFSLLVCLRGLAIVFKKPILKLTITHPHTHTHKDLCNLPARIERYNSITNSSFSISLNVSASKNPLLRRNLNEFEGSAVQ